MSSRTSIAIARERWLRSEEGRRLLDAHGVIDLRTRLEQAFLAGAEALADVMAERLGIIEPAPTADDVKTGGVCPKRTGSSLGYPQPHLWTSVLNEGREFYPCICGEPAPEGGSDG